MTHELKRSPQAVCQLAHVAEPVLCSGSVREGDVGPAAEDGGAGDQTEGGRDGPAGEGPAAQGAGQSSNSQAVRTLLASL